MDIGGLVALIVWIIILGLVFYLLYWLIGQVPLPAPFAVVAKVLLALVAVLVLLYFVVGIVPAPPRIKIG